VNLLLDAKSYDRSDFLEKRSHRNVYNASENNMLAVPYCRSRLAKYIGWSCNLVLTKK